MSTVSFHVTRKITIFHHLTIDAEDSASAIASAKGIGETTIGNGIVSMTHHGTGSVEVHEEFNAIPAASPASTPSAATPAPAS